MRNKDLKWLVLALLLGCLALISRTWKEKGSTLQIGLDWKLHSELKVSNNLYFYEFVLPDGDTVGTSTVKPLQFYIGPSD